MQQPPPGMPQLVAFTGIDGNLLKLLPLSFESLHNFIQYVGICKYLILIVQINAFIIILSPQQTVHLLLLYLHIYIQRYFNVGILFGHDLIRLTHYFNFFITV